MDSIPYSATNTGIPPSPTLKYVGQMMPFLLDIQMVNNYKESEDGSKTNSTSTYVSDTLQMQAAIQQEML